MNIWRRLALQNKIDSGEEDPSNSSHHMLDHSKSVKSKVENSMHSLAKHQSICDGHENELRQVASSHTSQDKIE